MLPKLIAEFIGTFWLVLGGCGSAVLAAAFPQVNIGLLGVSFAFGPINARRSDLQASQLDWRLP